MSLSRRRFLTLTGIAGATLALGCTPAPDATAPEPVDAGGPIALDMYITLAPDGAVQLVIPEAEMGQGILTGLAMVLADELEVPWDRVSARMADADDRFGRQGTGGSTSMRGDHDDLRRAAAAVREMLITAAAARWSVDPAACTARNAKVFQSTNPNTPPLTYAGLAADAAALTPPAEPTVKPAAERRLTGISTPRLDLPDKVTGATVFGLDVRQPDQVFARVARPPGFGGRIMAVDDTAARAIPGVLDVVQVPTGVAVVAVDTWAAQRGREALAFGVDPGPYATLDDAAVRAACIAVIDTGAEAAARGDMKALAGRTLKAEYNVPYLAHATMEPMNCTARVGPDGVEVWAPTQGPTSARAAAAKAAGVDPAEVVLHSTFMGGGFGRRSQPDYVAEAVHVAKALTGRPVQVSWSREDDTRGGWYRPVSINRLSGAVGPDGLPIAWEHRIATPSILAGMGRGGGDVDGTSIEGAANLPYSIPNFRVTCGAPDLPVPLWFWRSVGSSQNAYVTECFLDELAALGGRDPVDVRLALLGDNPRHARALTRAVEMAKYGAGPAEGHALGVAVAESFGSICAQVADVSFDGDTPRVHRVWCAIDCGQVVNPDSVVAQMESCIAYGLSAALYGRISIKDGVPVQSNFHDYPVVRMADMPAVDVAVIAEGDPWGGVGEPGLPPLAPAVCNAIRALRNSPVRTLPILG
ncbi:MAG: isoquinoline 1-oxidoreductase beta subunit [Myxococcota bacterium]|jgi:isoquinoline 1-oxidoreductase beta subunit